VPLILAIEPDRHQSEQLTVLARRCVAAELVLAESAVPALTALGDRVPDLILTPPLLSPRDDEVITDWLRHLGDAASHVRTLTTPPLATPVVQSESRGRGLFGALRRYKPIESVPDGCAPETFASEIRVYLDRALEARGADGEKDAVAAPSLPQVALAGLPEAVVESVVTPEPQAIVSELESAVEWLPIVATQEPILEAASFVTPEPSGATFASEVMPAQEPELEAAPKPEPALSIDVPMIDRSPDVLVLEEVACGPSSEAAIEPVTEALRAPVETAETPAWEITLGAPVEAELKQMLDAFAASAPIPESKPAKTRKRTSEAQQVETPLPSIVFSIPKPSATAPTPAPAARRTRRPRPAEQHEDWAFFNPEETRFAALLTRLDEITNEPLMKEG
jgi:hypothetical protein